MNTGTTLLEWDDTLRPQVPYLPPPVECVDLRGVHGVRKLCARDTLEDLRARLAARTHRGCTLLGSDDCHHLSYVLAAELTEPFTLVLFDNHSDFMPNPYAEAVISCGSWVEDALALPNLGQVVMVGVSVETMGAIPEAARDRVVYLPHQPVPDAEPWLRRIPSLVEAGVEPALDRALRDVTRRFYVSVDKDVMPPEDARVTWTQGTLRYPELLQALTHLRRCGRVAAVDICGDEPLDPLDWARGEAPALVERDARANRGILDALRG